MDTEITYLLRKIGLLKERYDIIRDGEEKFNIFSVMHKNHDERRLHSRFLAALLNPIGSHGTDLFLHDFIDSFEKLNASNFKNAIVYPEEWNKKENNNIDILIIDRTSRHAIIIENKIYAGDSNTDEGGQLERYYNHIRDNERIPEENIHVFYLTLDGHSPSAESLGAYETLDSLNGECISYENHITSWMELCLRRVPDKPFIRESILQYLKLINTMTNNLIDLEERLKLKAIIAQNKDSIAATKYLIDNFKHVKWHTIHEFWCELEKELQTKGLEIVKSIDPESITQLTHFKGNKKDEEDGINYKINEGLQGFVRHEKDEPLFWGFEKNGINDSQKKILKNLIEPKRLRENDEYWWNYFEFSNNEMLWLKDFANENTFNLIDPVFRKNTIKKIVDDISKFIEDNINKSH